MNYNNLAQKSNFSAGSDKLDFTNFFLTSLNIPGFSVSNPEVGGRSGTNLLLAGDSLKFNDLSFTMLIDEDFLIYQEFTSKIFNNVNPETGTFATIEFDFWIEMNNSKGNSLFKIEFKNCKISSIGDIDLDAQSDESEYSMSVEVVYDVFKIIQKQPIIVP